MGKHGVNKSTSPPAAVAPSSPKPAPAAALTPGPDGVIRANGHIWTGTMWIPEPPSTPAWASSPTIGSNRQQAKTNSYLRTIALILIAVVGGWLLISSTQAIDDNQNLVCSELDQQAGTCP